jgi:hypothetical protein
MEIASFLGLIAVIPTVMLITVSFFVMFALNKTEKSVLRIFGMVAVGLLWISALIIFSAGLKIFAEGSAYFGYQGLGNSCNCRCPAMMDSGCGMKNFSYHKKMLNPYPGMMNTKQRMMPIPTGAMMSGQPSAMPLRPDLFNKDMIGNCTKK